jgi:hypothetical protein
MISTKRALTLMLASLAMVVLTATAAWAPKYLTAPVVDGPCKTARQSGELLAQFTPTHFVRAGGKLIVVGELAGSCDVLRGSDVSLTNTPTLAEATIVNTDCQTLALELGRGMSRGASYDLEGDPMVFATAEADDLLCQIAAADGQPRKQLQLMNAMLAANAEEEPEPES